MILGSREALGKSVVDDQDGVKRLPITNQTATDRPKRTAGRGLSSSRLEGVNADFCPRPAGLQVG